jgi:hypothetical protein
MIKMTKKKPARKRPKKSKKRLRKKLKVKIAVIKMNNKKTLITILLLLLALFLRGFANPMHAAEDEGIVLTWQEVSRLFDLKGDKIKLTWKEFQTLLRQMGHQIDKNVRVEGGIVTLSRDRFNRLLQKMQPAVVKVPRPPREYIVTEAGYSGAVNQNNCRFTVRFKVFLFGQDRLKYISIPILSARTAVSGITVNGLPGMMQIRGGWYHINLKTRGYHDVKATFSVAKNKQSLSMPIIRAVVNTVDFSVPFSGYDIDIQSALNKKTENKRITAFIPPTGQISIKWQPKSEKRVKKPALFYAQTHALISVAADIMKIDTRIDLEVLQSSLDTISLRVPEKDEVVRVTGSSIKNWQVREVDIGRVLEIHLGYDVNNRFQFTVHSERMLAADTLGIQFKGLQVLDARRETGAVGIVAQSEVEVEVKPGGELEKLEFHQLPKRILSMSSRPVLYSYKYARHPFGLDIALHKHRRLEGISTVIESAVGTALVLPEGKMVFKMVYTVRNSFKQFMELDLPENAAIWTVLVDNKREKASRNKKGKVLIPLVRSSGNGDLLKSFKVELIYTRPFPGFGLRGGGEYEFPKADIFMNKIRMEMFLPGGYFYDFDKGDWQEVKIAPRRPRPQSVRLKEDSRAKPMDQLSSLPRAADPSKKLTLTPGLKKVGAAKADDKDDNTYFIDGAELDAEGGVVGGVKEEVVVAGKVPVIDIKKRKDKREGRGAFTGPVGLDSIAVHLPLSGSKFIFTKTIIDKGETYPLTFSYFHKQAKLWIYILLGFLLVLGLGFFLYKRKVKRSA